MGSQGQWSPPSRLPSAAAVTYWKDALSLFLLLVTVPWILYRLLTNPRDLLRHREGI